MWCEAHYQMVFNAKPNWEESKLYMHSMTTSQRCWTCNCFFSRVTFNKKNLAFYSSELTCYELLILALRCSQCNQGALPRVSSPFPGNRACFHFISFQQPCCTFKKHLAVVQRSPITSIQHLNPLILSFLLQVPTPKPSPISSCGLWR